MHRCIASLLLFFVPVLLFAQKDRLLPVKVNHKWGYINTKGELIISPVYDLADDFIDSMYTVTVLNGRSGIINRKGKVVLEHKYDELRFLSNRYFAMKKDSLWGITDTTGKVIYGCFADEVQPEKPHHFQVKREGHWGITDRTGTLVLPVKYDSILYLGKGYYRVDLNEKQGIVDTLGHVILEPVYQTVLFPFAQKDTALLFSSNGKWGVKVLGGKLLTDTIWHSYKRYGTNFIYCYSDTGRWLCSLSTLSIRTDSLPKDLSLLSDCYLRTEEGGKSGAIDSLCRTVIRSKYDDVKLVSEHIIAVQDGNKWAVADATGKMRTPFSYDEVLDYNSFFGITRVGNNWGLLDRSPKEMAAPLYSKIDQLDEVFKLYDAKGGLKILYYTKNGVITEANDYSNVQTIRIGDQSFTGSNLRWSTNSVSRPIYTPDKYGWCMDTTGTRWGIKDTLGNWRIKPLFTAIHVYDSLGLTEVEVKCKMTDFSMGTANDQYSRKYGLVDHVSKKILLPPDFLKIDMKDFRPGTGHVARYLRSDGTWGLVTPKGIVKVSNAVYIGPFYNGLARVNSMGKMSVGSDTGNAIMGLDNYMAEAMNKSNFSVSHPGIYVKVKQGKWFYCDNEGEIHPFKPYLYFEFAEDFVNSTAIVKSGGYGLLGINEAALTPSYFRVNYLPNTDNTLFAVTKLNPQFGFVKANGLSITALKYDATRNFHNGFAAVHTTGKWCFIDTSGNEICKALYDKVEDFSDGHAAVCRKGKWGFIDESGTEVIACKFRGVGNFSEGIFAFSKSSKWGYMDASGKILVEAVYFSARPFHNGFAVVKSKEGLGLIDISGKIHIPGSYRQLTDATENGLVIARKGKRYGMLNTSGEKVLGFSYTSISDFKEGFALLHDKKRFGFADSNGKVIIVPKYKQARSFSGGLAAVSIKGKWTFIDEKGNVAMDTAFGRVGDFTNGYSCVSTGGRQSFIDQSGRILMPMSKLRIQPFTSSGYAIVQEGSKKYFIDASGKNIMNKKFDDVMEMGPFACVNEKGRWGIMSHTGLTSVSCKYDQVGGLYEGFTSVKKNCFTGVCSSNGKFFIEPVYDLVDYKFKGVFRVESNEKIGYIRSDGSWIWKPQD